MMKENQCTNDKNFITSSLFEDKKRLDGRGLDERRMVQLCKYNDTIEVEVGGTKVCSKVFCEIIAPQEGRSNQGIVVFKNDFMQDTRHSRLHQQLVEQLLDKVLKGSKAISLESLSILNNHCVWKITVVNTLLCSDGNLVDAFYLASIISLSLFRKAFVKVEGKVVHVLDKDPSTHQKLSINHLPICLTYALFTQNQQVLSVADPTRAEQMAMDAHITIAINVFNEICAIHKPGGVHVQPSLIEQLVVASYDKVKNIIQLIRQFIQQQESIELQLIKNGEMEIE